MKPWLDDSVALADAVRHGDVRATDVLEASLDAIGASKLNAIAHLDAEGARQRAEEIDREVAAGREGVVDGAARDRDFAVSRSASVISVEQALADDDPIGRVHGAAHRVFDSQRDVPAVRKPHETAAGALHRRKNDAIADPDKMFEVQGGARFRNGDRSESEERSGLPAASRVHRGSPEVFVRTTPAAAPCVANHPSSVDPASSFSDR